jgi:hypothetical protein
MADERSNLERELALAAREYRGGEGSPLSDLLEEAAERIGEMRRALEECLLVLEDYHAYRTAAGCDPWLEDEATIRVIRMALGKEVSDGADVQPGEEARPW